MAGCGSCGKRRPPAGAPKPKPEKTSGQTQSFALIVSGKTVQTFGSRLEAQAENVRRGHVGFVKSL